jgi:hypothetical protein
MTWFIKNIIDNENLPKHKARQLGYYTTTI